MNAPRLACDAILFDLDGVLIDSTAAIVRHWQRFAGQHGLDLDTVMQAAHGIRTIETIRLVAPYLDAEHAAEQFTAHELTDTDGVYAIEGAHRIVGSLPEDAWTIVTSGGHELARVRLKAVGLPVPDTLVTGDDVMQGKPSPEPYLVGARRLGVPVGRCIVVEDAPAGVMSGKKAGMRVIGITATHSRDELLEAGADVVTDRLTHLGIQAAKGYRLAITVGGAA